MLRHARYLLSIEALRSFHRLNYFRQNIKGGKAVILCNGPSLNDIDFSLLRNTFCIGLNKINLLFDRTNFRPDLIVSVNPFVMSQNKSYFQNSTIPLVLDGVNARRILEFRKHHMHILTKDQKFGTSQLGGFAQGGTVTFVAMQMAYYLGFSEVALVGCDHAFKKTGEPHELLQCGSVDLNHFDERYFAGEKWQSPDLAMSEKSYQHAKDHFEKNNRHIFNCSTVTALEIFPKLTLTEFLKR